MNLISILNDWSTYITIIILLLEVSTIVLFLYPKFIKVINENPFEEYDQPQIATSLGVLGTFLGIAIGLSGFDSGNLQKSIPVLLDSMKTAFWTSIIGMLASLYMKYKQEQKKNMMISSSHEDKVSDDATITTLIEYLQKQSIYQKAYDSQMLDILKTNKASLESMTNSLVGDGESTLITQIKILKSDTNDMHKEIKQAIISGNNLLIEKFDKFAQDMVENNSKAFIEALEEVIRDFNSKVSEQFGDNFKQLNIAVGKLLEWQEHYKNIIIESTENQKNIFLGIEQSKISLNEMANNSLSIQNSANKLSDIIVTSVTYQQLMEETLINLNDIARQASNFIPSIKATMKEIENHLINANSLFHENANQAINNVESINKITHQKIGETVNSLRDVSIESNRYLQHNSVELKKQADSALEKITNNSLSSTKIIDEKIKTSISAIEGLTQSYIQSIEIQIKSINEAVAKLTSSGIAITSDISNGIKSIAERNAENLLTNSKNMNKDLENALN